MLSTIWTAAIVASALLLGTVWLALSVERMGVSVVIVTIVLTLIIRRHS